MTHKLPIEYLSDDAIRAKAEGFLAQHHPSGELPIPIEDIIDRTLGINIVPFPSLRRVYDADAFITADMSTIFVDEYVYFNVPNRYHFSLAHEIGHAVLHQKVYRSLAFTDIASWEAAIDGISEEDHSRLEWQAYAFAGLVLVPPDSLKVEFANTLQVVRETNVDVERLSDESRQTIARVLSRSFKVSTQVMEKRIDRDELWST